MYQLILPFIRKAKSGRGSQKRRRHSLFKNKKIMPCIFCGEYLSFEKSTTEHVIPKSKGGPNIIENLAISCKVCNNDRKSIGFDEWKVIAPYNKLVSGLIDLHYLMGRCVNIP
jgi:5-methylcytosine-specific restriction endonuclease McrA